MLRRFPLHTLLLAIFPVLFLYVHNLELYSPHVLPLPLVASIAFAAVLWALFRVIARDAARASVLASFTLILFFSYGHLYALLAKLKIDLGFVALGPHRTLFLVFGLGWLIVLAAVLRAKQPPRVLGSVLNTVAVALVAFSLLNLGVRSLSGRGGEQREGSALDAALARAPGVPPGAAALGPPPDVYYIILDGYARADVLRDIYGLDNAPFLSDLRARGFRVLDGARANYMQTSLSLASSLNLDTLDDLARRPGPESADRRPLLNRIQHSRVRRFLETRGYTSVAFASGYWTTEMRSADIYLSPAFTLDEFQSTLVGTTPLPAVLRILGRTSQQRWHRQRIRFAFDRLARLRESVPEVPPDRPVFVFAHIVCPHPPFVFEADGSDAPPMPFYTMADGSDLIGAHGIDREQYVERYRAQIEYVNHLLHGTLDGLTRRPAIIVVQGDHGPGSRLLWEDPAGSDARERLSILCACRFPDGDSTRLRDDLTPVNLWRTILNQYFGTDLPLLPDRSWFSTSLRPYCFVDVTERVP
jgi:hypothetical protein